jgi:hypothetical protein
MADLNERRRHPRLAFCGGGRSRRWLKVGLIALIALWAGQRAARAATCTWISTSSSSFGSGSNWSCAPLPNHIPTSSDDIVFDGTSVATKDCTLSSNISANSITFQNSYSHALILGSHTATVAGSVTVSSGTFNAGNADVTIGGSLSLSGGTFSSGSGGITIGGGLSVTGGAFTASSATTQVSGSFGISGGTFTSNGGTVTLSGSGTLTSGGNSFNALTISGTGTYAVQDALSPASLTLSAGTLAVGSNAITVTNGVTVQTSGTLTLGSGGSLAVGTKLTMDGTLSSTGGTIKARSGSYTFEVGSTAGATPALNVNGLTVQNVDSNGMMVNGIPGGADGTATGASTTFTRFDKVAFGSGTGTHFLHLFASSLYLSSNGCTFDGSASHAVALTASAGMSPRAIFGNATCATNNPATGLCATSEKLDDDSNNDGVPDATTGAVVQFIRSVEDDTAGSVIGFPTAAFNWNTFTYYSTYAAFHDASGGTADTVYVRDGSGNPLYSWTVPTAAENINGTPEWLTNTVGGVTTHYLYVATNGASAGTGKIYRLVDSGTGTTSGTLTLDVGWTTNPVSCGCTIATPLVADNTNLYWGSTTSGKNFFTMGQSSGASSLSSIMISTAAVTSAALSIQTLSGTSYSFLGLVGNLLRVNTFTQTTTAANSSLGSHSVVGRIIVGTNITGVSRVYAGDDGGTMWAIDPTTNFTHTGGLWSYVTMNASVADSIKSSPYYDYATDTIQYGTQAGQIVVLDSAGATPTGYPYTPSGGSGDPITAAPLFRAGILVVGSTGGKLYFIDRKTVSGGTPKLLAEYYFGPSQSLSGVAFDPNSNRYMVTTGSTTDGHLYYFDNITDPTAGSS